MKKCINYAKEIPDDATECEHFCADDDLGGSCWSHPNLPDRRTPGR